MHTQDNSRLITFREKMAWVMVIGLIIASVFYFGPLLVISSEMEYVPKPAVIGLTIFFFAIISVIATIGAIVAALSNVDEADLPMDERDRQISSAATRVASPVTGIILIMTSIAYFFDANSSDMLMGILAALVFGHLAEYLTQIFLYRRRA